MVKTILTMVAAALFLVGAFKIVHAPNLDVVPLGLFCWLMAQLVAGLKS